MSRLLDYQFDAFAVAADGTRTIDNAGTLGASNDVTMDTGQMLDFDGADDYIYDNITVNQPADSADFSVLATINVTDAASNYRAITGKGWLTGGNGYGMYVELTTGYAVFQVRGSAITSSSGTSSVVGDGMKRLVGVRDGNVTGLYINKSAQAIDTAAITSYANTLNFSIGARDGGSPGFFFPGIIGNVTFINAALTQSDVDYDFENPEAIINMALGNEDSNFSFVVSDIESCYVLMEGTGNTTIKEIVTNRDITMTNFPGDDTQWTNADLQTEGLQNALLKQTGGVPTALADAGTLRFDP